MSEAVTDKGSREYRTGPVPGTGTTTFEAEAAAYMQGRLRLVATVLLIVVATMLVVPYLIDRFLGECRQGLSWFLEPVRIVHIAGGLVVLGFASLLRRPCASVRCLRVADAAIFLVTVTTSLVIAAMSAWVIFPFIFSVVVLIVVTRAVVVPSSGRRTFLLSIPVPAALTALFGFHLGSEAPDPLIQAILYNVILLLAVGIATLASHITFSLRREVHEAKRLGPYELEGLIGEGGMGEVYRGTHALLKRPTAVKLLRPEIAGPETLSRFEREVREASRLTHPNTIRVYDYGQTADGVFYYAMELLDGLDLDRVLQVGGPLPPSRVIHVLEQACAALDEAHHLGLVHRDIKPGNIFLCRRARELDVVKVLDFGLVKDISGLAPSLTQTGVFVGTPLTGAPEMFFGDEVGPAADLYSLGVVGYKLLAGKPVFDAEKVIDLVRHHMNTPPAPISEHRPDVPADLETVILSCLNKKPEDRPASAEQLRRLLLGCADAGRWTQNEARGWWAEHRPEGEAPSAP